MAPSKTMTLSFSMSRKVEGIVGQTFLSVIFQGQTFLSVIFQGQTFLSVIFQGQTFLSVIFQGQTFLSVIFVKKRRRLLLRSRNVRAEENRRSAVLMTDRLVVGNQLRNYT